MADILCSAKTEDVIFLYIGGLDNEWTTDDRIVKWYMSQAKSSGYVPKLSNQLLGGIRESGIYDFSNLSSGTSYYIKAEIYQTVSEEDLRPAKILKTLGPVRVTTYPSLPSLEIISKKPERSSIKITGEGNTDGFLVEIYTGSYVLGENPAFKQVLYGESSTLTVTGLLENTKYDIYIYPFILLDGEKYFKEDTAGYIKTVLWTDGKSLISAPVITLGDGTTDEEVFGRNEWFWYAARFYITPSDEECTLFYFRYKKENASEWSLTAEQGYEYENNCLIQGLEMCCIYEIQARTYSEKNGFSEWCESYILQTLGADYIGASFQGKYISFDKAYIDEMLSELENAGFSDVYTFKVQYARYFGGKLFEADLLSIADIKKLPLYNNEYYKYSLDYDYGSGSYRMKMQVFTAFGGKLYEGRRFSDGLTGTTDVTETVEASEPVSDLTVKRIDGGFKVEWSRVSNAEQYRLTVSDPEGNIVSDSLLTAESKTLTGLSYSTVYSISVRVIKKNIWSAWSDKTEADAATAPPIPLISAEYSRENKTITVFWQLADTNSYATYVYVNLYSSDDTNTLLKGYTISSGETSGEVVFEGITQGTYIIRSASDYDFGGSLIQCVDSTGEAYTATLEITAEAERPENFTWLYPKTAGEKFNLTAEEWGLFTDRVNEFLKYLGRTEKSFTKALTGDVLYAGLYNEAGGAIKEGGEYGLYIPEVISGQTVTAYQMNILVNELNAIE